MPIIGPVVRDSAFLQLFRSFALLQEGGMSALPAFEIAVYGVDNIIIRAALLRVLALVHAGYRLSDALQMVFTDRQEAILLVALGEESGTLPIMVKKIASLYDMRLFKRLRNYTLLVQPLCMVILGILVAFLIIAVYMPLFDLADLI